MIQAFSRFPVLPSTDQTVRSAVAQDTLSPTPNSSVNGRLSDASRRLTPADTKLVQYSVLPQRCELRRPSENMQRLGYIVASKYWRGSRR